MKRIMEKVNWKIVLISCLGLFAVCLCTALVFIGVQISKAPKLSEVNVAPEGYLTTILDHEEQVVNTLYVTESNRIHVELKNIPMDLQEAFIAIEDARFYSHNGVDIRGLVRAVFHGIKNGGITQGASTITQQLLKNNVFTGWMEEEGFLDSLSRKIQEQYLAVQLEKQYSKEWILENYLNTINLGGGTRGVQVAARYYFGKDVSQLTLAESALIAGITKNPTSYNPLKNPEKSLDRQKLVLNAMLKQEKITQEEYDAAVSENIIGALDVENANRGIQIFSWFEDAMLNQIVDDFIERYGYTENEAWDLLYSGGLTIYSTMNRELQDICEDQAVYSEHYTQDQQISIVMTDVKTGAVVAIVGGSDEKTESLSYNRATDAIRQPGSLIKVIGEYAAALDTGKVTLGTVLNDEPYAYSDGTSLRNSYGTYKGMTSIREGIYTSSNVLALKTYQLIGQERVFQYLKKFGITTLTEADKNEALAIGGTYNGVTNLEMTAAYNAIANSGNYVKPYFYTKVTDRNGTILLEQKGRTSKSLAAETAELLTVAMQDVLTKGTGKAAAVKGLTLAGKSGTTNENKDVWFVGFSSEYTCGIWGGHDDYSAQDTSSYVKKIWKDVMGAAHKGMGDLPLVDENVLIDALICTKCGNLAVEGLCDLTLQGNMTQREFYMPGSEPTEPCDCHVNVTVCQESGAAAGRFCPYDKKEERVYLKAGTAGTADEAYVLLKALEEPCDIHKNLWDIWFDQEQESEQETDQEPEQEQDDEQSDESETDWWESFFGD